MFGDAGVVPAMRKGSVVITCATVAQDFAKDMEARCNALGIHHLDALISGSAMKTVNPLLAGFTSQLWRKR